MIAPHALDLFDPHAVAVWTFYAAWLWAYACLVEALRRSPLPLLLGLLDPGARNMLGFCMAAACLVAAKAAACLWPLLVAYFALRCGRLAPAAVGAYLMGRKA